MECFILELLVAATSSLHIMVYLLEVFVIFLALVMHFVQCLEPVLVNVQLTIRLKQVGDPSTGVLTTISVRGLTRTEVGLVVSP